MFDWIPSPLALLKIVGIITIVLAVVVGLAVKFLVPPTRRL